MGVGYPFDVCHSSLLPFVIYVPLLQVSNRELRRRYNAEKKQREEEEAAEGVATDAGTTATIAEATTTTTTTATSTSATTTATPATATTTATAEEAKSPAKRSGGRDSDQRLEEPFRAADMSSPELQAVLDFYGIPGDFPVEQLWTRSAQ